MSDIVRMGTMTKYNFYWLFTHRVSRREIVHCPVICHMEFNTTNIPLIE